MDSYKLYILLKKRCFSLSELEILLCEDKNYIVLDLIGTLEYYISDSEPFDYYENLKKSLINVLDDGFTYVNEAISDLNDILSCVYTSFCDKQKFAKEINAINSMFLSIRSLKDEEDKYEFIKRIIFDIKNISYLRQILNLYPYYVNSTSKSGEHILIYLIEEFIRSNNYIYLDSVIHEFLLNPKFNLSGKEYLYINKLLKDEILKKDNKLVFYESIINDLEKNELTYENIKALDKKYGIRNGFTILEKSEINPIKDYIIAIDSETTLDRDDAISIRREEDHYLFRGYIANVSYYVKRDSYLDKEAFRRSETIYLSDQSKYMLPVELSNDIISLNTSSNKRVIVYEAKVYFDGSVSDFRVYSDVIRIDNATTYNEVNNRLKNLGDDRFSETLYNLSDMAYILKKNNPKKTLYRVIEDELDGTLNDKNEYQNRTCAEIIVEECMILINRLNAENMYKLGFPFIYRCHKAPSDTEDYSKLLELKKTVDNNYIDKQKYIKLLSSLENMYPRASYSLNNTGHFGLGLKYYSHSTSPIRRYPDLCQQRELEDLILGVPTKEKEKYWTLKIDEVAEYCNKRMQENKLYEREYERIKTFLK